MPILPPRSQASRFCNGFRANEYSSPGACQGGYNRPVKAFPGLVAGFLLAPTTKWKATALGSIQPRWLMTPIEIVGGLFGLFAVGLIVLLIYKSTLTMHEDDQLFLDDANSHMQEEQTELLVKVNKLTIPMRVFSIGSGVFLLAFVAMLIYQKLNEVQ
jgi:multisubunit Na+/H+ antiporter MnhB subunit